MKYLKQAIRKQTADQQETKRVVSDILEDIRQNKEEAVKRYALHFDDWSDDIVLPQKAIAAKTSTLPRQIIADLQFAYDQVYGFALEQKKSMRAIETELYPGIKRGQKHIPCSCAGCYVPGGRYAHAASAIMSIATARAAGVPYVVACSPSHQGQGIHPVTLAAMSLCKPDLILTLGGVQAIGAMAYGLFTEKPADIIVGPGNRYVAEAKRILFGEIGIDVIAGPTESLLIADHTADPLIVAVDLMSQAEHGYDSPVWLVTDSEALGEQVLQLMPRVIKNLPEPEVAETAWRDFGEIVLCEDRQEMAVVSDQYAAEHVQVQAEDLDWWLDNLINYGSLFLGEAATVAMGDKASGTNHILPTGRAARYSGGLNTAKFLKTVTYQRISREASLQLSAVTSRISRVEGMEGHARAADVRLRKYFPDQDFDFEVSTFSENGLSHSGERP